LLYYDINALSNFVADATRVIGFDPHEGSQTISTEGILDALWILVAVFGGWLRNVEDEAMQATWDYTSRLARRSEGDRL
jgi:hypothetical protein